MLADPKLLERALWTASQAALASEKDLTRWDTIVGDGDW